MRAYLRPLRGELGAGDGGRLWPSISRGMVGFPAALALPLELSPAMVVKSKSGFGLRTRLNGGGVLCQALRRDVYVQGESGSQ